MTNTIYLNPAVYHENDVKLQRSHNLLNVTLVWDTYQQIQAHRFVHTNTPCQIIKMPSFSNLDATISGFWQLARHWNQGFKAKLELSCEDGNIHMRLSAVQGPFSSSASSSTSSPFYPPPPLCKKIVSLQSTSPEKKQTDLYKNQLRNMLQTQKLLKSLKSLFP